MLKRPHIFIFLLLVLSFCKKDDLNGSMSVKINGELKKFISVTAITAPSNATLIRPITITGKISETEKISFQLIDPKPGTIHLANFIDNTLISYFATNAGPHDQYLSASGTLTILSYNNGILKGSFEFSGTNIYSANNIYTPITVTEGLFEVKVQ
jgi:hypothetical protein